MRTITISRVSKWYGADIPFEIYMDDQLVARIENGRAVRFNIDYNSHVLEVLADMGNGRHYSEECYVSEGRDSLNYRVYQKAKLIARNDLYIEQI